MKDRADKVVAGLGLAESRQKAQALIMAGLVFADGQRVEKPGFLLDPEQKIQIKETLPFVSRGGLKLDEALDVFDESVEGKTVADLGASTGGFVDCLLQRGARKVFAVDVDTRQIDVRLREDPRVSLIQKNARYLDKGDIPDPLDIITMDLSFISVLKVLPAVHNLLDDGPLISLVKPQFEVGRRQVGKKGIVRDPSLHEEVLNRIATEAEILGFQPVDVMKPSVRGQKGNQEFFILFKILGTVPNISNIPFSVRIKEAVQHERN
jgi:23S rRNA (cytidine1920-2'-O)/16S rRNA (cytidine1409-2'-O)-methyltransferase